MATAVENADDDGSGLVPFEGWIHRKGQAAGTPPGQHPPEQWSEAEGYVQFGPAGARSLPSYRRYWRKAGSKKSILVDAAGGPLSVAVAGANVHDTKLLRPTLESIVVARPEGTQNLCLDKGYDNPTGHGTVAAFQYCPHIRRIGEEKLDRWGEQTFPARRWVVERTLGWLSKCRAILVRYDKKASNYVGLIQLACALLWYRRQHRLLF